MLVKRHWCQYYF